MKPARPAAVIALLVLAAACGDLGDDDLSDIPEPIESDDSALTPLAPEPDDAVTRSAWATIGTGVSYKTFAGKKNVLLVYGGYKAQDVWVQRWANALVRARGASLDIGHVYAVRGPNQAGYANREIQNSKIAAHLGADARAAQATSVTVIAHSSGTYVADELFGMIDDGTLAKVRLYNLDGGGVASASRLMQMDRAYFVYARDARIQRSSHNAGAMQSLGARFASKGGAVKVDATGSGCSATSSGGLWCLHDAMIVTRPANPNMYDLRSDYTSFTGSRSVVVSYLDAP